MKAKSLFFLVTLLIFLFYSCEKEETITDTLDPELSDEDLAVLDTTSVVPLTENMVLMPDGKTLKEYLLANDPDFLDYVKDSAAIRKSQQVPATQDLLIAKLSYVGLWLGQRDKYKAPYEGENKPAHYGLAYSYGSKQYIRRTRPPAGECKAEVYGLDCSGYVAFIFNLIGIPMIEGRANDQRQTDYLLKLFSDTYGDSYEITVTDMGKTDPAEFKTGDIIYWTDGERAYHIGLILKGYIGPKPLLVVAHSTGSSKKNCSLNYTSLKRGVCLSDLSELLDGSRGRNFSRNYRIVRYTIKLTKPCGNVTTVSYNDQTYHTIEIGNQCWLKEDLNIGSMVLGRYDQSNNGVIEKYCYDDKAAYCAVYGGLYQWDEAVKYTGTEGTRGICPEGWHIPSKSEFDALRAELEANNGNSGDKMKEAGTTHWKAPNEGATNSSGFTGLPGGKRWRVDGTFMNLGEYSTYWTSTQWDDRMSWTFGLGYFYRDLVPTVTNKQEGISVRCIKDK